MVTFILIFALFTQISIHDLWTLLKKMDPLWALIGSASHLLATLLQAFRFRRLIHSKEVSLFKLFKISLLFNLANMVLPSKMGELSYPYLLNRFSRLNVTEGLASLIASRVYDLSTLIVIFLFTSAGFQTLFKIDLIFMILFAGLLIGVTLLLFFYMNRILLFFSNVLLKVSRKTEMKESHFLQWFQGKFHQIAEDFYAIKAKRTTLSVTLSSMGMWMLVICGFYSFLRGLGIELAFLNVAFGSTLGILASSLPISAIGNWGTLEVGWAAGFIMVGLSKEEAVATGLSVHILIFVLCLIAGLICWFSLNLTFSHSGNPDTGRLQ